MCYLIHQHKLKVELLKVPLYIKVLNLCVLPKIKFSRKIFLQMTHVDTQKGVAWQHFHRINFHEKHKKRKNHENLVPQK